MLLLPQSVKIMLRKVPKSTFPSDSYYSNHIISLILSQLGSIEKLSNYISSAQEVVKSLESVSIYYGTIYLCSFNYIWIWLYLIFVNIIPFQITQPQFTQSNQLLTFWSLPSGKSLWEVLLFQYWWWGYKVHSNNLFKTLDYI